MIRATSGITLAYGLLVAVLGIMGYTEAQSLVSLLIGGLFGALIVICAVIMAWKRVLATYCAIILVCILLVFFGFRFSQTSGYMPAVMSILSVFVLGLLIRQIFSKRSNGHI